MLEDTQRGREVSRVTEVPECEEASSKYYRSPHPLTQGVSRLQERPLSGRLVNPPRRRAFLAGHTEIRLLFFSRLQYMFWEREFENGILLLTREE